MIPPLFLCLLKHSYSVAICEAHCCILPHKLGGRGSTGIRKGVLLSLFALPFLAETALSHKSWMSGKGDYRTFSIQPPFYRGSECNSLNR